MLGTFSCFLLFVEFCGWRSAILTASPVLLEQRIVWIRVLSALVAGPFQALLDRV